MRQRGSSLHILPFTFTAADPLSTSFSADPVTAQWKEEKTETQKVNLYKSECGSLYKGQFYQTSAPLFSFSYVSGNTCIIILEKCNALLARYMQCILQSSLAL